jgi:hypothetical protein
MEYTSDQGSLSPNVIAENLTFAKNIRMPPHTTCAGAIVTAESLRPADSKKEKLIILGSKFFLTTFYI